MADPKDTAETTTLTALMIHHEIEEMLLCCAREIAPEPMELRGFGPTPIVIEAPIENLVVRDGKLVDVRTGRIAPSSTPVKIPQRKSRYENPESRPPSTVVEDVIDIFFGD